MPIIEHENLAWCVCNGTTIFLDIANDRYFRLSDEQDHEFHIGALRNGEELGRQPACLPRPSTWRPVSDAFDIDATSSFSLSGVGAAVWIQRRTEKRLAERGLRAALIELAAVRRKNLRTNPDYGKLASIVSAFEHATLLRTAADRCLPRSIAMIARLAKAGIQAELVIGVRSEPFGAHCWAQQGPVALNETVEEARRYEPILVI